MCKCFNNNCCHDTNTFQYLRVQFTEQAHSNNLENIEDVLWDRENIASPSYS